MSEDKEKEGRGKVEAEEQCLIMVRFGGKGSAEMAVQWQGVSAVQMLMAAEYLRLVAERRVGDEWAAKAAREMEMAKVKRMLGRNGGGGGVQ